MDLDKEIVYAFLTIILTVVTWLIRQRVASEKLDVKSKEYALLQMLVGTAVQATEQLSDGKTSENKLEEAVATVLQLGISSGISLDLLNIEIIKTLIEEAVGYLNKEKSWLTVPSVE